MEIICQATLDALGAAARESPRLRMNRNFHATPDAPAQRLLNALEPGTVLPVHRHPRTAETYVVLSGRLRVDFYDDSGAVTESAELSPRSGNFGVHIPAGTWHGLEIFESAVIFEVKDGPYVPISPENVLKIPAAAAERR